MGTTRTLKKAVAGALLSGSCAAAVLGLTAATAQAEPGFASPMHDPLAEDGPVPPGATGPYICCPGQEHSGLNPQTGRGCPGTDVNWDKDVCHTWYGVYWGHGNVAPPIWEGPQPPPPEALQKPWCGFPFMCSGTP
jgi:hypothetical protein